ncbi:MAG: hypothetical protein GXO02_01950 [Epsilonproteobacteria bacterium]|nr:hypothetical protein [Campylobacterota bacterium]
MVVFIVEGITDKEFFEDFLNSLNIEKAKYEFKIFKGKDNIFKLSHCLYNEIEKELDIIDKLFIAVDADDPKDKCPIRGYKQTEEKLKELIKNLDFKLPVDYFIFSDEEKEKGYLESFLLSVLDNEQKECIEEFKNCYKYELSDKWVFNTFYKQKKYPFDYNHPNFNELKQKLINLFKEE